MTSRPDYPYIRAWARCILMSDADLQQALSQARLDNAPTNAVYRQPDGNWRTTDDIIDEPMRDVLGLGRRRPDNPPTV